MQRVGLVATLWVALVTATNLTAVAPPKYAVTDLGSLGGGSTTVAALNAVGEVTGSSLTSQGLRHAFLYSRGVMTDVGTLAPAGSSGISSGLSINNAGQVSGNSTYLPDDTNPNSNTLHVFLYSGGVMTDVGILAGERNFTNTGGLNDSGQITGTGSFDDQMHAFLWSGGVMKDLGTIAFEHSSDFSSRGFFINAVGQVAGTSCCDFDGFIHGFLYSNGVMQDLGIFDGTGPTGLNDAGQVIFEAAVPSFGNPPGNLAPHAFLYSGGERTDLGTLGGLVTVANAINASGQITGLSFTDHGIHAFLYNAGANTPVMMDLGTLATSPESFDTSQGRAINTAGQITGDSQIDDGSIHAFLYTGGVMYDLNNLIPAGSGWTLNLGIAINDLGQIAGSGGIGGVPHAFLLSRVPQTKNDCKGGDWRGVARANGTVFKNQGDCVSYVNTGK